jgi:hypothetical protein
MADTLSQRERGIFVRVSSPVFARASFARVSSALDPTVLRTVKIMRSVASSEARPVFTLGTRGEVTGQTRTSAAQI